MRENIFATITGIGIMAAALLVAITGLLACPGPSETPPPATEDGGIHPGMKVDMNALIGAPADSLTWRFDPAFPVDVAAQAGLAITPEGMLTVPDCRLVQLMSPAAAFPFSIHVQALSGTTVAYAVTIVADEEFLSTHVACYMVVGTDTVCRDPSQGISVPVDSQIQFYALSQTTCSSAWSPPLPDGACPVDPAFAFCQ